MKHNNPFKMIGSWMGLAAYIGVNVISLVLAFNNHYNELLNNISDFPGAWVISTFNLFPGCIECWGPAISGLFFKWFIGITVWFLAGWLVQNIIKKVGK